MSIKLFIPAIIWFVISTILLTLPGDDLPHSGFFNIPYFDKMVHLGMFFLLTALFSLPFISWRISSSFAKGWFVKILMLVIVYGIAIEFIQKNFSAGRSFDVVDILFDSAGALAAYLCSGAFYRKKIGPDGNQGRNQN